MARAATPHTTFIEDLGAVFDFVLRELVTQIEEELRDTFRSARERVFRRLVRRGEPSRASPTEEHETPMSVIRARREHDTAFLIGALDDRSERHLAAQFLAQLWCVEAAPKIEPLLDADDLLTRAAAAHALGSLDAWKSKERLRALAEVDPSVVVRGACFRALGCIGDVSDVPVFEALLETDWFLRSAAVDALAFIDSTDSLDRIRMWRRKDRWRPRYLVMAYGYGKAIRRLETNARARERGAARVVTVSPEDAARIAAEITEYDHVVRRSDVTDDDQQVEIASALLSEGYALWTIGRDDDAIAVYDEILTRFSDADGDALDEYVAWALLNKAGMLTSSGRRPEAVLLYDAVVSRFGDATDPELEASVGQALVDGGVTLDALDRDEEALENYDEALSRFGAADEPALRRHVARALLCKGFVFGEHGRNSDQLAVFDDLVKRFGDASDSDVRDVVVDALIRKAGALSHLRRASEAVTTYDEALERLEGTVEPESRELAARARLNRGVALAVLDGGLGAASVYDGLIAEFGDAIEPEIRRSVAQGLLNKARALQRFNHLDQALLVYDDLTARFGRDDEPQIQHIVDEARRAQKWLRRRWLRWLSSW